EIDALRSLEVSAQLDDEHAAVAVERDLGGVLDEGIREHGRHPVAGRERQAFGLLLRRQRKDWRLRRQVRAGVRRIVCIRRCAWSAATAGSLNGSALSVLGVGGGGEGDRQCRYACE